MTPRLATRERHALFPQLLLDVHDELIIDLFAGGGGASLGIEMATGRQVDVAINHDAAAVALHLANHPQTKHLTSDVFEVDPREVAGGRPIGLLWASPDCTFHSKARGAKPIRPKDRKRRALAWVVTRWAGQVRPRVICLENVEEFAQWGPLVGPPDAQRPCPRRRGRTFRRWVRSLERLGYRVEWRELRACDYGAPTIRKRLYLIARCDGAPIVWPEPTHGPDQKRPFLTAASCIDWSIPMLSIFATHEEARAWGKGHGQAAPVRPLAEATMRRVARGVMRYVVQAARPFIVPIQNAGWGDRAGSIDTPLRTVTAYPKGGGFAVAAPILTQLTHHGDQRSHPLDEPAPTVTGAQRGELGLVAPFMVPRYGERLGQEPRTRSLEEPAPVVVPTGNGGSLVAAHLDAYYGELPRGQGNGRSADLDEPLRTQTTENRHALVASFLAKHYGGHETSGAPLNKPASTLTTQDHHHLVAAHIQRDFGTSVGHDAAQPLATITSEFGGHAALVASFLSKYYGVGIGQPVDEPAPTVTTKDRFGLVTVTVAGTVYAIVDICMRMLQPRELFRAQGFPDSYRIERGADGRKLTKTEQVRMVGNSVSPPQAAAIVATNCPWLVARDEVRLVGARIA